jgi:hypothetical protein
LEEVATSMSSGEYFDCMRWCAPHCVQLRVRPHACMHAPHWFEIGCVLRCPFCGVGAYFELSIQFHS